jgi:hypothetical protein
MTYSPHQRNKKMAVNVVFSSTAHDPAIHSFSTAPSDFLGGFCTGIPQVIHRSSTAGTDSRAIAI